MATKKYKTLRACFIGGRYYSRGEIIEREEKDALANPSLFVPLTSKESDTLRSPVFDPTADIVKKTRINQILSGTQAVGKTE